jgi:hypothetical protein
MDNDSLSSNFNIALSLSLTPYIPTTQVRAARDDALCAWGRLIFLTIAIAAFCINRVMQKKWS